MDLKMPLLKFQSSVKQKFMYNCHYHTRLQWRHTTPTLPMKRTTYGVVSWRTIHGKKNICGSDQGGFHARYRWWCRGRGVARNLYMGGPIWRLKSMTMSIITVWIVYIFKLIWTFFEINSSDFILFVDREFTYLFTWS